MRQQHSDMTVDKRGTRAIFDRKISTFSHCLKVTQSIQDVGQWWGRSEPESTA